MKNYWYIIAAEDEIKKGSYLARYLLGLPLLIARNRSGDLFAMEDRCCHRNVQLSLGEFDGDNFTCGYHGWVYNSCGDCINIPSEKNGVRKRAIRNYPLVRKYGFIWIWVGDETPHESLPPLPELEYLPMIYTDHEFDGDIRFVSESLFDPYHINHVHKNSIKTFMGDLNSDPVKFSINATETSLYGEYKRKNNSTVFEKTYFGHSDYITTKFEFHFPNISKIQICFEKRTLTIYEHMVEVKKNRIKMYQITSWENIFAKVPPFARWFMKRISEKIVGEDIDFFKSHFALQDVDSYKEVHTSGDQLSLAFRKIWDAQTKKEKEHELVG